MIDFSKIKGAIFDVDGTLLDSMWKWQSIEAEYIKMHGRMPKSDFAAAAHILSQLELAAYLRTEYSINKAVDEIDREKNKMMESFYFEEAQMKSGVAVVLEKLHDLGISMCVATATDKYLVENALKRLDISKYFGKIFTCGEEQTSKTNPDIFIRAVEFLGTDISETVVFEDAPHAIESAKSAGFPIVALYDKSLEDQQAHIKSMADVYCIAMDEILGRLDYIH